MKLSELIARLQELQAEHGDVDTYAQGCCCDAPPAETAYFDGEYLHGVLVRG